MKAIQKRSLIYMKLNLLKEQIFIWTVCSKTRFYTEAKGNLEMAHSESICA